jgi:RNA polymerase sigma factor (sigma-70 family)
MSKVEKNTSGMGHEPNSQVQKRVERTARIFKEHGDLIRAIIRSNLPEEADANDIFQDFFLSLISKPVPDTEQNVEAYLYRAIKNDIVDAARRTKSYRHRLQRYAECHRYETMSKAPNDIMAQSQQVRKMFQIGKHKLAPREFKAIIERFAHDLSIDEAARRMRVSKKTYSQYLWAGLKKIRGFLKTSDTMNLGNFNT